jgi:signal transduction histidine kinase
MFEENFKATTSLAGVVLGLASASSDRQRFAEQFVQLIGQPKAVQEKPSPEQKPAATETNMLEALSEMAAGAAHELNNPLSVISGRAQLLADSETDAEKKRILKQIRQNAGDMAGIVDDLMNFAKPTQPRPASTGIKQILEEAIELTTRRRDVERIEVQTEIAADARNVFVDSAQIASAIANIFSNSLESYPGELGPIKVTAGPDESGDFLKLQIADSGCGMDEETLRKATQPFFSAKPAGRKRGMGLALAQRIIQSNGGSLEITSQPGKGTTVTILLPYKS